MAFRQRTFFWRLLYAFFAGGLVPFVVLAVSFGVASTRVLENAWRDRSRETIRGSAELSRILFSDAETAARSLAASDSVREYMTTSSKNAWLVSEVNRLFSSTLSNSAFSAYLVPLNGAPPFSRSSVPDEYLYELYSGWGILGSLSRSIAGASAENPDRAVFFGQPHPASGTSVPVSVGVPVRAGGRVTGFVIVDISRQAFSDRVGSVAASGGALTNLFIEDRSGLILYDMVDGQDEASFAAGSRTASPDYLVSQEEVRDGIVVTGLYPVNAVRSYSGRILAMIVLIAGLSMLASLFMAIIMSRQIARPVHLLTLTMERVSQGQLGARCEELPGVSYGEELAVLAHRFNLMIDRVNGLVENLVAQERELRRAETQALQAQINPHFLYNTLNSIRSMARLEGSNGIADMTTSLARIIREGAYAGTGVSTLAHSLDLARDYFSIESARWPGRFTLEESIDPGILDARMPRLIIQPIVENALVHGLEAKPGEGLLSITGRLAAGDIVLTVRDTGVGIPSDRLESLRAVLKEAGSHPAESSARNSSMPGSRGFGIALVNTQRRLSLMYGLPYGIDIVSAAGEGTTVTICFPHEREGGPA
jgi:two-component system sensor histidine kinase YesM